MKIILRLIALVFLGLSADNTLAQHWRQYQHDGGHRGQSNVRVVPAALAPVWSAAGFIEPRILGDTLYARKRENLSTRVAAFSLADGQEKWNTLEDGVYFGNLAVAKDFLILEGFNYDGGFNDVFVVLDAATGQERYRIDLPFEFSFSEPNLVREAGGLVAYCTDGGTIAAVQVGKERLLSCGPRRGTSGCPKRPSSEIRSLPLGLVAPARLLCVRPEQNPSFSTAGRASCPLQPPPIGAAEISTSNSTIAAKE